MQYRNFKADNHFCMFSVEQINNSGFDKVLLTDTLSGTIVEVIPSCGAILHSFAIIQNGEKLNVIDNYESSDDFKTNLAAKGFKSCKLSPFACRVKNAMYRFDDTEYTIQKFLLGKNALHGLIYDASYVIINQSADTTNASVVLQYKYDGSDPGYPFQYICTITYTLTAKNNLTIQTTIENIDERKIPIQDGWHPYFTFGNSINDLLLEFQSSRKIVFDDMIPTGDLITYEEFGSLKLIGEERFDDCFELDFTECQPLCVLRDKSKNLQIQIYPDTSYPYLQIYTPDHRKSIAIENLSAIPDTFNNGIGLKILQPNETITFTTTYTISSIQ